MGRRTGIYALYHGDEFIDLGSVSQIAQIAGVKEQTVRMYASAAYRKRINDKNYKNRLVIVRVEGEYLEDGEF